MTTKLKKLRARPGVYLIDSARTPFLKSGTQFKHMSGYELGRLAVSRLVRKLGHGAGEVDLVVAGTVLSDPEAPNVAREIGLGSDLAPATFAFTVSTACASANVAISSAIERIQSGHASLAIAGGTELLSDPPIRVSRAVRERLVAAQKIRSLGGYWGLLRGLRPRDFYPSVPAIAEFSTGETMGAAAERLAKRFGISRREQDEYALTSHERAARATSDGHFAASVTPVFVPPDYRTIIADNGIRLDTTREKLALLGPAFDASMGTVTAGNSSFLSDGAAFCVLGTRDSCERTGRAPLARVLHSVEVAGNPSDELLLGPVFALNKLLVQTGLSLDEIDVFEIHEAFASQVLACLRLIADGQYCKNRLGRTEALGEIPKEKLNAWGGSLAIGHPFGATGARLLGTCAARLQAGGGRFGIVATCAAGALGHAFLVEATEG